MLQLRYYQKQAVESFFHYTSNNHRKHPIMMLPTGSGKSLVQAHIVQKILSYRNTRILLITHQKELIKQNYNELIVNFGGGLFDLDIGIYSAGLKCRDTSNRIIFAGIQSVYKKAWELGWFDVILIDECHLLPHKGEGTYRTFLADMKEINEDVVIGGLSATAYRLKDGLLTEGKGALFDDICHETTIKELIDPTNYLNLDNKQYLCGLISKSAVNKADLSGVHIRGGEYVPGEMEKAFQANDLVCRAVREIKEYTPDRKKILVFTAGIAHCEEVSEKMNDQGLESRFIHSQQSDEINQKNIKDFKAGKFKYLINVNVLTTGFNEKAIDCIILLRSTMSPGLYYQMCLDSETEILTKRGFLKYDEIKDDDIPASLNIETNEIEWDRILNTTKRDTYNFESFYSFSNNYINFRITNEHDLLVRSRRKKKYIKEKIQETIKRKDFVEIPVSGIQKALGAKLLDCEIEFLGWFLSDGNLNKKTNAISISQSTTNIHYCDEIEKCLIETGMKYGKHIIKRKNKYADQIVFTISYGMPRGRDKHKKGWKYLSDFIDKNINEQYEKLNREQIVILLDTINKGDGVKRKNVSYIPRTMSIAMGGNKIYAENFQSLIIRRGFRCNMKSYKQKTEWNKNPKIQYILKIKDTKYSTIPGKNISDGIILNKKPYKRTKIVKEKNIKKEFVWCIETKNGTIITRRNGKPVIMGNCGRGLRMHLSKIDCLVLDFGRNVERHGPIDKIEIRKKKDGTSEVGTSPQKECPECNSLMHPSVMQCLECGYKFPEKEKHEDEASDADILSKWKKPEEIEIQKIEYNRHCKTGKPDSLRVDYYFNFYDKYSKWVSIENPKAKFFALKWLKNVTDLEINSVDEALEHCDSFRKPSKIIVDLNGKFPNITGYIFEEIPEEINENKIDENNPTDEDLARLMF